MRWLLVCMLMAPALASAQIYKCQKGGETVFSDSPCGKSAQKVQVHPVTVGGRLDSHLPPASSSPAPRSHTRERDDPCPYISSTRLRSLKVSNQIAKGMTPGQVSDSWGEPNSVYRSGGLTQWAYNYSDGSSRYVYFRHGCVSSLDSYDKLR